MLDCCPFCTLNQERIISKTKLTVTISDGFPVSPGHTLIIPKRHVASFFELAAGERNEILKALDLVDADREAFLCMRRKHCPERMEF